MKIEAFIDNNLSKKEMGGVKIVSPTSVVRESYDAVVVATKYSYEIYCQAEQLKFDLSKFIFVYNNYQINDLNMDYELVKKIFPVKYAEIIKNRYHMIRGMQIDEISNSIFATSGERKLDMYEEDYNRIRTFELVVNEIRNNQVEGSVAELGVFKGEFAKYINEAFRERKCYLFDTFEGFREDEAVNEKNAGNCGEAFIERFKNTSQDKVLEIMPYPDSIVCKQGLFPESLEGLEDRFAFVSLDVDFQQAIYDGLEYFYPRLNQGGYIFVHDYNSKTLHGVKEAVKKYEVNQNIKMAKVPIADLNGTLVITK